MTILSLVFLASCFPNREIEKTEKSLNFARISENGKAASHQIVANLKSDSLTEITAQSTVFDDVSLNLDNPRSELLTDTAKLLAGMNISDRSELALLKDTHLWADYRVFFSSIWSQLEKQKLSPIRQWSQKELTKINLENFSVFYPFSKANFLQVYSLFPQAKEYILISLEPVGNVPDLAYLSTDKLEQEFQKIKTYLDNIFPVNDLLFSEKERENIKRFLDTPPSEIDRLATLQALPVLYIFLAKTNNRIINVEYIGLDSQGQIKKFQPGMISGVKITFITQGSSESRTLYYFSADLSNESLETNLELLEFLKQRDRPITYLEKAAYLMYFDSFSQIKDLILSRSSYLLQNDSGIPVNVFESARWNLKFYGNYTRPIDLFKNKYQPELWNIYHSQNNIKPLTFSSGYQSQVDKSNLMLAENKLKL
ncbi:MAG: hypothetical protein ACFCU5_04250 [Pleurocapsa sp.]